METPDVASPMFDYERERGKPRPSKLHSITQKKLTFAFHTFEPPYTVFSELTIELSERYFTPDLSAYGSRPLTTPLTRFGGPSRHFSRLRSRRRLMACRFSSARSGFGLRRACSRAGWCSCAPSPCATTICSKQQTTYADGTVTAPNLDISGDLADVFAVVYREWIFVARLVNQISTYINQITTKEHKLTYRLVRANDPRTTDHPIMIQCQTLPI